MTANLAARVWQHRGDEGSAHCRKYGIRTLVLAEHHDDIETAIRREKALKAWRTQWKHRLIAESNPKWRDLFDDIV
ncbi:hypothetical protein [Sphingomonas sp. 2R-10]|uniref:hypothetical protein n=1 Tax=Sphingomonas sp. 2R-10 TaxID=3045148 RepID=UPI001F496C99